MGFYSYLALGTDRYPPFTLKSVDYPADLEVYDPKQLSRGLVFVKWWLLVIAHYIVLAFFQGGIGSHGEAWSWFSWYLPASCCCSWAGIIGMFAFVMGMKRWTWRVAT